MLVSAYAGRIHSLLSRHHFDLIWLEKEALPWLPVWFEKGLLKGVPFALDFDDAIFHNYDRSRSAVARALFSTRIDELMSEARLVVTGNDYLAARAMKAGSRETHTLPTVVDLDRYSSKAPGNHVSRPRIVWIGTPSSARYLSVLAQPLQHIARTHPFTLRVIGGAEVHMSGVDIEIRAWSEDSEADAIGECDIGVMPLFDTEWEKGKCAYKLIQYMACGLPTVASRIGSNCEVTIDGQTGFLPRTDEEWIRYLKELLEDAALRRRLGEAGRKRVEENYSLQRIAPQLVTLLCQVGGVVRCAG
jgi:glycosyltransferase involved in cell wall biosynthesis